MSDCDSVKINTHFSQTHFNSHPHRAPHLQTLSSARIQPISQTFSLITRQIPHRLIQDKDLHCVPISLIVRLTYQRSVTKPTGTLHLIKQKL